MEEGNWEQGTGGRELKEGNLRTVSIMRTVSI